MNTKVGHRLLVVALVLALVLLGAACGGSDRSAGPPRPIGFAGELQRILDQAVSRTTGRV